MNVYTQQAHACSLSLFLSRSLSRSFALPSSSPSLPIERRHPSRSALHQCEASTRLGLFRFFLSFAVVNNQHLPLPPVFGATFRPADRYPRFLESRRAFTRIDSRFAAAFPTPGPKRSIKACHGDEHRHRACDTRSSRGRGDKRTHS